MVEQLIGIVEQVAWGRLSFAIYLTSGACSLVYLVTATIIFTNRRFRRTAASIQGKVVAIEMFGEASDDEEKSTSYRPWVAYKYRGKILYVQQSDSTGDVRHQVGQDVSIHVQIKKDGRQIKAELDDKRSQSVGYLALVILSVFIMSPALIPGIEFSWMLGLVGVLTCLSYILSMIIDESGFKDISELEEPEKQLGSVLITDTAEILGKQRRESMIASIALLVLCVLAACLAYAAAG